MVIDHKLKDTFIKLIISEDQAIGIYEAELFLKGQPRDIFQKILADEISHEKELIRIIVKEMQKIYFKFDKMFIMIIFIFVSVNLN